MQDENQSTSEIWSSFDYYKVVSMHILHAAHDSLIMKENEYKSTKHSFKNTFSHRLFSRWQDSNKWQSNWDYSCITRDYREVYFLSKVIDSSMRLLKSDLLESRDEIIMITSCIKIAKYFKDMKRLFEIQWSQKQDH